MGPGRRLHIFFNKKFLSVENTSHRHLFDELSLQNRRSCKPKVAGSIPACGNFLKPFFVSFINNKYE
uniref:Uncharacterized protein n=1 Tax=Strongyloides venezuelensis TaxID=75913 RepID=A0A0K0FR50_STRVS